MDPRHFFATHQWIGKIIGGLLGYLVFGPSGALFGVLIGNIFDRGLTEHYARPYWLYHTEKSLPLQKIFFEATFTLMGHLARTEGAITEAQIKNATQLIEDLRLNASQKKLAQHYFHTGTLKNFDLWPILSMLRVLTKDNPKLANLLINIIFQAALVDGLSVKKERVLNTVLGQMGFAPLYEQGRFYERPTSSERPYTHTNSKYSPHSHDPYNTLAITREASQKEVQRAYRRLISRHHPDKLMAKGASEASIKLANEKTQKIRKAYETICEERGW